MLAASAYSRQYPGKNLDTAPWSSQNCFHTSEHNQAINCALCYKVHCRLFVFLLTYNILVEKICMFDMYQS